jgi:2-polyprenyl-6-methoxyphenol hydroxylase-like FAD-dependent oxidoreductase
VNSIGIVGSGIAGLHLALFLQQHSVPVTLYSDRTAEQIRASRLPSTVARFEHTRARERALGVDHWSALGHDVMWTRLYINGEPPLTFRGDVSQPWSFVDMRLYLATLLGDFEERGGEVIVGAVQASDVARLANEHDLVVVASGRASLTELFPRVPEHSPYTQPQRRLCAGYFHGIENPEPLGFYYTISPGQGEIFQAPFYSFEGRVSNLLFEAIPGQGLDVITQLRYQDDPRTFEATVLKLLREHVPIVYERVNPKEFGLTRPLDLLQGAITPTVRRGYLQLESGKFVVAIGDVHVLNDPLLGQGANAASHAAWVLGEAILNGSLYDELFCHGVEQRIWAYARPVTEWTNAALQPPPHVIEVFVAAAQNKAVADQLVDNFNAPQRNWEVFSSPERAASFLRQFGWNAPASTLQSSELRAA